MGTGQSNDASPKIGSPNRGKKAMPHVTMAFNVAKIASARASLTISLTKSLRVAGPKVGNPAGLLCRRIWYSVGKSGVLGITEYRQGRPLIICMS